MKLLNPIAITFYRIFLAKEFSLLRLLCFILLAFSIFIFFIISRENLLIFVEKKFYSFFASCYAISSFSFSFSPKLYISFPRDLYLRIYTLLLTYLVLPSVYQYYQILNSLHNLATMNFLFSFSHFPFLSFTILILSTFLF